MIGNEILKGRTADLNTQYVCSQSKQLGVEVRSVSIVPDVIETIAAEVATKAGMHLNLSFASISYVMRNIVTLIVILSFVREGSAQYRASSCFATCSFILI